MKTATAIVKCKKLMLMMLVIAIAIGISGCDESYPPHSKYSISIWGLKNYTGGDVTRIMVPIVLGNGEPVYGNESFNGRAIYFDDGLHVPAGNWTQRTVETENGRMIEFRTSDRNLTDIHTDFELHGRLYNNITPAHAAIMNITGMGPLYPISSESSGNYTIWVRGKNVSDYTSYVYIDKNLEPMNENYNNSIVVELELYVYKGVYIGSYSGRYRIHVFEVIPGDARGMIPVKVQR